MKIICFFIFFVYCFGFVNSCFGTKQKVSGKIVFRSTVTCINSTFFPVGVRVQLLSGIRPWINSIIAETWELDLGNCKQRLRELEYNVCFAVRNDITLDQPVRLMMSYRCISEASCPQSDCYCGPLSDQYKATLPNSTVTTEKDEHGNEKRVYTFDGGKIVLPKIYKRVW